MRSSTAAWLALKVSDTLLCVFRKSRDTGKENGSYYNGDSNGKKMENDMETGITMV